MRDKLFRLPIYASIIQQFLFCTLKESIPEINFMYGIPLTHQISFHTILLGDWYLPIFFILFYFSGYFSCHDNYQILIVMRNRKRSQYFIKRIVTMVGKLLLMMLVQLLIGLAGDAIYRLFFRLEGGILYNRQIGEIFLYLINYFVVLFIIVLLENLLELFFESINSNVIVNILIIISIIVYNYNSNLRKGICKLVNISMYARTDNLRLREYLCLVATVFALTGIMFFKWKRQDLLGGKNDD